MKPQETPRRLPDDNDRRKLRGRFRRRDRWSALERLVLIGHLALIPVHLLTMLLAAAHVTIALSADLDEVSAIWMELLGHWMELLGQLASLLAQQFPPLVDPSLWLLFWNMWRYIHFPLTSLPFQL